MNCIISAWGKHEAELRGYLTRQSNNATLAEDILQETFLRAISEGANFCSLENPRAWLFRVARNQFIDQTRTMVRRNDSKNIGTESQDELIDHVEEIPAVKTLDVCLPKALANLSLEDREAIQRCDLDGERQSQFAKSEGISVAGAKSRVQRARKRLKVELVELCNVNFDKDGNVCCYTPKGKDCC